MSRSEKLLQKAKNNPQGLSFNEFKTLLSRCGWSEDHQTGSHCIWYSPTRFRLSIQDKKGMAKSYQVKQFLVRYEQEMNDATQF